MPPPIRTIFKRAAAFCLFLFAFSFSSFPAEITVSVTVADTTPPAAITNLTATTGFYPGQLNLTWTSTGDDGLSGIISSGTFAVQHSTWSEISWSTNSAQVSISTSAVSPGSLSTYPLSNLLPGVTYYIRIWTADEVPNWSPVSLGATSWAQTDQFAPAAITNLSASCATDGTGKVTLTWTAPKEDGETGGAVSSYDLRYATSDFSTDWNSGTQWTIGIPTGAIPGTTQNLALLSLANGNTYYFITKSADDAGNTSDPSNLASTYVEHLLISEIQQEKTGNSKDEFIELHNPLSHDINLQALGIYIRIRNSAGTDGNKTITWINSTIRANGYFLIVGTGTTGGYNGEIAADATYVVSSGNTLVENGALYISTTATNFTSSPGPWGRAAIDLVGFGSQPSGGYETQTTTSPPANQSIERRAKGDLNPLPGESGEFLGNACDTNNNTNDLVIRTTPNPQNSSSSPEPDTIPPAAITNLTASSEIGGTIKLTWSAPGDDSSTSSLPAGSQYRIRYSTESSLSTYQQIILSTSNIAPGTTVSTVITDLTVSGTYYIRLWTADEVPNWSDISNSANIYFEILSLNVDISTLDFEIVAPDTNFNIAMTSINVTNTSTVNSDFVLSGSNTANWTLVSSTPTSNSEFRLLGIFNTAQPVFSNFDPDFDTVTAAPTSASATRYAGNQNGNNVPPGETRNLWLCFSAPRSYPANPTRTTQSFTIGITVQKTP